MVDEGIDGINGMDDRRFFFTIDGGTWSILFDYSSKGMRCSGMNGWEISECKYYL